MKPFFVVVKIALPDGDEETLSLPCKPHELVRFAVDNDIPFLRLDDLPIVGVACISPDTAHGMVDRLVEAIDDGGVRLGDLDHALRNLESIRGDQYACVTEAALKANDISDPRLIAKFAHNIAIGRIWAPLPIGMATTRGPLEEPDQILPSVIARSFTAAADKLNR